MPKAKGKARTPPFGPYPEWSQAKFFGFLRSGIRAKAMRWPPIYECLNKAKRNYVGENKRQKFEYLCNVCKQYHAKKVITVDHIIPAGSLQSFEDLPGFVERLFCGVEGLQTICDTCHGLKTAQERADRKGEADEEEV